MKKNLVVFDIDGTLTLGDGLGTRCFFAALERVLGATGAERRLEAYAESTDGGIAREVTRSLLGREATAVELEQMQGAYLASLTDAVAGAQRAYRPILGADRVLSVVKASGEWDVAIATGNWRGAAQLKLRCAGIEAPNTLATSEDGTSRAQVLAAARARAAVGPGVAQRVLYVGDQPWDLRAARELGVGFIGIGHGERAERLAQEGAPVIGDYADCAAFLRLLAQVASATPPWAP